MFIGTSVGAPNGTVMAAHPERAALTDRGLRRLTAGAELPSRITELGFPFTGVAMGLATGTPALLDHRGLGEVIAYVPVRAAVRAGAASVVVNPTGSGARPALWDFGHSQRLISGTSTSSSVVEAGL